MCRRIQSLLICGMFAATSVFVAAPDASAQQERRSVKKRSKSKQTVKRHHHKRGKQRVRKHRHHNRGQHHARGHQNHARRHHHRGHGPRAGVTLRFGTPYLYYGGIHGPYHGHHHHSYRYYRYPTPRRVVVVERDAETLWEPPALTCPSRTKEAASGYEQWCATIRDNRHGPYRRWYDGGTLAAAGEYEYDQRVGLWVEYHPNGAVREQGEYRDGNRSGTWVTWDADGKEVAVVDY